MKADVAETLFKRFLGGEPAAGVELMKGAAGNLPGVERPAEPEEQYGRGDVVTAPGATDWRNPPARPKDEAAARRGDYANDPEKAGFLGELRTDYFDQAQLQAMGLPAGPGQTIPKPSGPQDWTPESLTWMKGN
jgi:hypothetical protein